jgi:hypothetical protein
MKPAILFGSSFQVALEESIGSSAAGRSRARRPG